MSLLKRGKGSVCLSGNLFCAECHGGSSPAVRCDCDQTVSRQFP